ncbi:MAG: MBL fold metallo-hydrolase [Deltaproteobacteria bacterium]|nr:MBL fold metallo-hydrolase [Deltaproteobacteria bacterium]
MHISILGVESLGVRSLSCIVETKNRKILIDPGVALGLTRQGLLPHPVQVRASEDTRHSIKKAAGNATDVVFSHYHGDHCPLANANPYQLSLSQITKELKDTAIWGKAASNLSIIEDKRAKAIEHALGIKIKNPEGLTDGPLSFSYPVPHGPNNPHVGTVMMTKIEDSSDVFVHASDIQMLNDEAIQILLDWRPDIVLASGPPIYLGHLSTGEIDAAKDRILSLSDKVKILILDHHVMRSRKSEHWVDNIASVAKNKIICAADFMGRPRRLLEADRKIWYKDVPVPEGWHEAYSRSEVDTRPYKGVHLFPS